MEMSCLIEYSVWNIKASANIIQKLLARLNFSKGRSNFKSSSRCQNCWYSRKGLAARNTRVKIKALAFTVQKILSKVKVSGRFTEWHNVRMTNKTNTICLLIFDLVGKKINDTHGKVLSQGILMWNIRSLALTVQKLFSKVKVFKKWVKLQGQGHRVKKNATQGKVLSCIISKL